MHNIHYIHTFDACLVHVSVLVPHNQGKQLSLCKTVDAQKPKLINNFKIARYEK